MSERTSFDVIAGYLPERFSSAMQRIPQTMRDELSELRLNSGHAAALVYPDRIMFLAERNVTASSRNISAMIVSRDDIGYIVDAVTHFSLHSHMNELRQGFFVIESGIRVGVSGVFNSDGYITDITGLCFRISRCIPDCGSGVFSLVSQFKCGVLVCGGVNSGKTTILRDLCRLLGERNKVTLVDERNEIAFSANGVIHNDVGVLTNVISGCSRQKGIISAIRTLSPQYIVCDEIAEESDAAAIIDGVGCGICFCASAHAGSYEELLKRRALKKLIDSGVFGYAVFLSGASAPGIIKEIRRL